MLKKIEDFLYEKMGENSLFNDLIYVCQGGSFISGTDDETSDLDFRGIVLLNDNYQIGLAKYDHDKYLSGDQKINSFLDLDVELFSTQHFIRSAYHGEIITIEMLYVDDKFVFKRNDIFNDLYNQREQFLSLLYVKKYLSFIKGCYNRSLADVKNLKRKDKIERTELYGFETKYAMNAIKCSRILIEFLTTHELNFYRKDKDELMSIKKGSLSKEEFINMYNELQNEINAKIEETTLPNKPDYEKINSFTKDYNKKILRYLNII